jgi:hypothetical protein
VLRKRLNGVLPCGKDYCQRTGVPPSRQPWCWAAKKHASTVEPNRVAMDNEGTPPGQSQCMRYPGWDNILPPQKACCYT